MGCDIHLGIEVRDPKTGKWETWYGEERPCTHCDGKHYWWDQEKEDELSCDHCDACAANTVEPRYRDRNYAVFGLLAGVRYISAPYIPPRGLPADVDPRTPEVFLMNNSDGHSTSWLTVAELQAIDLDFKIEDRECVSFEAYEKWMQDKTQLCETRDWSYSTIDGKDYEKFMSEFTPGESGDASSAARARWAALRLGATKKRGVDCVSALVPSTIRKHVSEFFEEFLPAIAKLGEPGDVRIVFDFDN